MKQNSIFLSRDLALQLQKEGTIKPDFKSVAHWIDDGIGGINLVYKKVSKTIPKEMEGCCTPAPTFEELWDILPKVVNYEGWDYRLQISPYREEYFIEFFREDETHSLVIDGECICGEIKNGLAEAAAELLLLIKNHGLLKPN